MDSAFNLTPDLVWGTGRLQPYAIQPCPVEDLLKAYLPDWLIAFLADMWQWVSACLTRNIPFFIFLFRTKTRPSWAGSQLTEGEPRNLLIRLSWLWATGSFHGCLNI